ncbi:MAG TPA: type II toxin-antitoxin system HicA family toxin [bacterium]|nr:type II toxin-antitoxin system HicA family toxin [bacterium]
MKVISGKKFCRILEEKGWELKRIHGSHHIFMRPGSSARISVPVHGNKTLKIGLQKHLMKVSGITEDEL